MNFTQFLKDTKRLFEPALINKWLFIRWLFMYSIIWGYAYFNVFVIKRIVWEIENWTINSYRVFFWFFVVSVSLIAVIKFIIRDYWWAELHHYLMKQIHRIYMPKFIELDNNIVENIGTGKMIAILNKWITEWVSTIIDCMSSLTNFFITFLFAIYIFYDAWYLYLVFFLAIFFIFLVILVKLNEISIQKRQLRTETDIIYNNRLVRMIMSKFEIYQNSKTKKEIEYLDKYMDEAQKYNIALNHYLYWMYVWPQTLLTLLRIAIYFFVWFWIYQKTNRVSDLIWIIALIASMENSLIDFVDFFKTFTQRFSYISKLWDTFDNIPIIQDRKWLEKFNFIKWDISIDKLSFSYWNNKVFDNFSLDIQWWKKTALVWLSWSGKTTLVKLIIGYLRNSEWKICIDWQDLSEVDIQSYYENIGYLTQDPSVFDGSIIENLTYWARWEVTEEELKNAIKLAQCDFIYELKDWLETQIWERWVRLSWWQKQRLAIAKIFIKNPKLIILDEPTSSLDSFSEEKISEAFKNLFVNRTVIVVAHRLQTVKEADEIIVLASWEIAERWNHKGLVEKWWIYARMLELQTGF